MRVRGTAIFFSLLFAALLAPNVVSASSDFFEIQVVDGATGRGVPLVELETVNHRRFLTDSAGRIALSEPGLNDQLVFFTVRSHGYEFPKDGFGYHGVRLKVVPGRKEIVRLKRRNIAERLYRITGEGIYRDSVLLGYKPPTEHPLLNAQVFGQDSVQRVVYRGKIHWFWGDTLRASYPLGNFRMSGAVSDLPANGGLPPDIGINLRYFTDADGFCKGMFPIEPKGDLIWADGFMVLPNGSGGERMIAHYQRLKGLDRPLARGLAIYNDRSDEFEKWAELDLREPWRFPHGHPIRMTNNGSPFFSFGAAFPTVRVLASTNALLNSSAYEAFSCIRDGSDSEPNRDSAGRLVYRWTTNAAPATPKLESELVKAGKIELEEARFLPRAAENGEPVLIHTGTVSWNAWRNCWILIGVQQFGTSVLGEIWYGESHSPLGPWKAVCKVVSHDRYSFYNPAHHPFLDTEGGRVIFFEGTYTAEFSGSHVQTTAYDYNQVMYRLDLSDQRLGMAPRAKE